MYIYMHVAPGLENQSAVYATMRVLTASIVRFGYTFLLYARATSHLPALG